MKSEREEHVADLISRERWMNGNAAGAFGRRAMRERRGCVRLSAGVNSNGAKQIRTRSACLVCVCVSVSVSVSE